MTLAYIALGANLGKPLRQLNAAVADISSRADCELRGRSSWYRTAPLGPGGQDDYLNGVIEIDTTLTAESLLATLQAIECHHGRERRQRWGPRTLDLDILLYGQQTICTPILQIPHPRMTERAFVLYPLAELAPDLVMPDGISITNLLENTSSDGIVRLSVGDIRGSTG